MFDAFEKIIDDDAAFVDARLGKFADATSRNLRPNLFSFAQ